MNKKPNIDEKKWRKLDTAIECILVIIATVIAQMIGTRWFDDSFIATLIIVIVAVSISICVKQFILSIIDNSVFLRKLFEKNED